MARPDLELWRLDTPVRVRGLSGADPVALGLAWGAFLLLPLVGGWNLLRSRWSGLPRSRRSG